MYLSPACFLSIHLSRIDAGQEASVTKYFSRHARTTSTKYTVASMGITSAGYTIRTTSGRTFSINPNRFYFECPQFGAGCLQASLISPRSAISYVLTYHRKQTTLNITNLIPFLCQ